MAMIDAGSSGCRVHVYRYGRLGSSDGPLYVLPKDKAKKVTHPSGSLVNSLIYIIILLSIGQAWTLIICQQNR